MTVFTLTLRYLWRRAVYRWRPRARPSAHKADCLKVCIQLEPNVFGRLLGLKPQVLGPYYGKTRCWKIDGRKVRSPLLKWYLRSLYDRQAERPAEELPTHYHVPAAHRLAA